MINLLSIELISMKNLRKAALFLFMFINVMNMVAEERTDAHIFEIKATSGENPHPLWLKSNALPWVAAVPNIGVEYGLHPHWSVNLDVYYCPWKISDRYSVKTAAILPEGRYWLKNAGDGSFFNVHLSCAWYNVRWNTHRYQDRGRPALGAGVGYGYRLSFNKRWGMELCLGAGFITTRYNRYHNVANGALEDTRISTYWGIDRLEVAFVYYLCDL